jgi:glycosyltransferase involved in cell wall biosynthesis
MRILLVSPSMQAGGAERVLTLLAAGLVEHGHDVTLAAPRGARDADLVGVPHGRVVIRDHGRTLGGGAITTAELAAATRRLRPHLVHAQNPRAAAMASVATRLAAPRERPPVLATFHGVLPAEYVRAAGLLRRADHVACVSQDLREAILAAGLPAGQASVIYNAVEPARPLSRQRCAALDRELGLRGAPVAAIVARIVPPKAHDRFVRATRVTAERVPSARFLIVGEGPLRSQTEAQVRASGLSDSVVFTGERADARELIARADVLVCSSDSEGMSIAVLEAMAAGTPVLSTDVQGMRELLAEGAGEIVPLDDGGALGERLAELLLDPKRCSAMGAVGQRSIEAKHSSAAMTGAYERRYRRLTAKMT